MLLISLDPVPLAFRPTTIKLRVSVHLRGGWGMGLKEETAGGVRGECQQEGQLAGEKIGRGRRGEAENPGEGQGRW